ncbi:MAG: hypothetical protein AAF182_03755 [Pseudomonadota bacterium]
MSDIPENDLIGETIALDPEWHEFGYFTGIYPDIDLRGLFTIVSYDTSGRNLTITFRDAQGKENTGDAKNFITIDFFNSKLNTIHLPRNLEV